MKLDFDNPPLPGQIGQPAHVVTLDAAGSAAATWTARFHRLRPGNKHNPVGPRQNLDNRKLERNQRAEGMEHGQITARLRFRLYGLIAPSVNPATCTKYAEEPDLDEAQTQRVELRDCKARTLPRLSKGPASSTAAAKAGEV
ncbi:hypothetical protein [Mesorhizobium sp. M0159]|uniref:hypothetical protein n=1 Tax=Mesorhizobium sp. M0159 TaxID=2956900 RepID=UPI003338DE0D